MQVVQNVNKDMRIIQLGYVMNVEKMNILMVQNVLNVIRLLHSAKNVILMEHVENVKKDIH